MLWSLVPYFNLPVDATNMFYQNGDCKGASAGGPPINGAGEIDLSGTETGTFQYSVLYNVTGDPLSCDYSNCKSIQVTLNSQPYIEFDSTDASSEGHYFVCNYNGVRELNGDPVNFAINIEFVDSIGNPLASNYDVELLLTFTEPGDPIDQVVDNALLASGTLVYPYTFTNAVLNLMQDKAGGDNSCNEAFVVSNATLYAYVNTENALNSCSDEASRELFIMPDTVIDSAGTIACTDIPNTADWDFYEYIISNNNTEPNSNFSSCKPNVISHGEYSIIVNDIPLCLYNQIDFNESWVESVDANSIKITDIPDSLSSLRHIDIDACNANSGVWNIQGEFNFIDDGGAIEWTCLSTIYNSNYDFTTCADCCETLQITSGCELTSLPSGYRYTGQTNITDQLFLLWLFPNDAQGQADAQTIYDCITDPSNELTIIKTSGLTYNNGVDPVLEKVMINSGIIASNFFGNGFNITYNIPETFDPECCEQTLLDFINANTSLGLVTWPPTGVMNDNGDDWDADFENLEVIGFTLNNETCC